MKTTRYAAFFLILFFVACAAKVTQEPIKYNPKKQNSYLRTFKTKFVLPGCKDLVKWGEGKKSNLLYGLCLGAIRQVVISELLRKDKFFCIPKNEIWPIVYEKVVVELENDPLLLDEVFHVILPLVLRLLYPCEVEGLGDQKKKVPIARL